ncbi:MAG TPA: hypothetical protein VIY48_21790 [Candidatus Paceibacterota bacterium]
MTAPRPDVARTVEIWTPANGLDLNTPVSRMDLSYLPFIQNFKIQDGYYIGREGTKYLNTYAEPTGLMASFVWQTPQDVEWILRFTKTQMQYYDWGIGGWINVSGISPNMSGGDSDYFQWTGYGSKLLFVNGKDGIYQTDLSTVPPTVTKFGTGPVAPKFITTFGGRVIASNISGAPGRIQWSVKNNSTDWSGIGSGYDDLVSTPGGGIDESFGVYPVNDAQALVVRSHSIWLMSLTGDVNVPHRFSMLYANFGCDDPYSIVPVPGGIVGLFRDNVYFVNEATIQPLGNTISSMFRVSGNENYINRSPNNKAVGAYDPDVREYRLALRLIGGTVVLRYGFTHQHWTQDWYPVNIKHIFGFPKLWSSPIYDSRLIMTGTDNRTFYETINWLQDVSGGGGYVDASMYLVSGVIRATDSYHKTRLLKIFVEYDYSTLGAFEDVEMQFYYSYDNWTWTPFPGTVLLSHIPNTAISRIGSTELSLENRTIQIRAIVPGPLPIKIYSVMVRISGNEDEPVQQEAAV